jgi:hypothetical protein
MKGIFVSEKKLHLDANTYQTNNLSVLGQISNINQEINKKDWLLTDYNLTPYFLHNKKILKIISTDTSLHLKQIVDLGCCQSSKSIAFDMNNKINIPISESDADFLKVNYSEVQVNRVDHMP